MNNERFEEDLIEIYSKRITLNIKKAVKETWDHQQKKIQRLEDIITSVEAFGISQSEKIDKLEEENEELKKLLGEAVEHLRCYHEYIGELNEGNYSRTRREPRGFEILLHSRSSEFLLSKPEIQKYLPEGEV